MIQRNFIFLQEGFLRSFSSLDEVYQALGTGSGVSIVTPTKNESVKSREACICQAKKVGKFFPGTDASTPFQL